MIQERRQSTGSDRRHHPRGGRRATDAPGRHPRVLVADSYEAALRPCTRYLEHFSFDVAALADGRSVAEEIDRHTPAIILMGTSLKEPSSRELLEQARRERGIPVILFADSVEESQSTERVDYSMASAVLVKPFTLSAMVEMIRSVLRMQAGART